MVAFGTALALWGNKTNLTARPQDAARTVFHIVDSLMLLALARDRQIAGLAGTFGEGRRVLDFGSGAGFPGLVLASASEARFTLSESRRRRASFLTVAAHEMALDNVEIIAARISHSTVSRTYDAVLSRASGPSPEFYALASNALVPGGVAILYASPSQRLDLAAARTAGLIDYRHYPYAVRRPDGAVERLLAVWRMPEKAA